MRWGKEAQDNEHWHLLLIEEKIREDAAKSRGICPRRSRH